MELGHMPWLTAEEKDVLRETRPNLPVLLGLLTDMADHELVRRLFIDGLHPGGEFIADHQADVLLRLAAALERDAVASRQRGEAARAADLTARLQAVWTMALDEPAARAPARPPLHLVSADVAGIPQNPCEPLKRWS